MATSLFLLVGLVVSGTTLKRIHATHSTDNVPAAETIKKCCHLKIQKNKNLNEIAKKMNNSWVRIMNRSLNDRGQISVESLEYTDTFLAVPRRKLKSFSRITIYDYSALPDGSKDVLMNQKFDSLVKNPMNRIFILPLINSQSGAFEKDHVVNLTNLIASVTFTMWADLSRVIGDDQVIPTLQQVIGQLFGAIRPEIVDNILDQMSKWALSHPKVKYHGRRMSEMVRVWTAHKFTQCVQFQTPIQTQLCPRGATRSILFQNSNDRQNRIILSKLLSVIRSHFPLGSRYSGQRPRQSVLATEIIEYWLRINDARDSGEVIHVLWAAGTIGDVFPEELIDWQRISKFVNHRNRAWIPDVILQKLVVREEKDEFRVCGRVVPYIQRPIVSEVATALLLGFKVGLYVYLAHTLLDMSRHLL